MRESFFQDRKSTRLNSSHVEISYAVFCLKKKKHYLQINLLACSYTPFFFNYTATTEIYTLSLTTLFRSWSSGIAGRPGRQRWASKCTASRRRPRGRSDPAPSTRPPRCRGTAG